MRNESDYIYYFSSEQKSEPKHAAVKCAPKHLKKHRHIRAIHLFALCYLLIAAMLMSTSGSFAKFTETSPVSVQSAMVASFNYDVKNLNVSEINKSDFNLTDTDIVVCAFEVSNTDAKGVSDVALSCDVNLRLTGSVSFNMLWRDPSAGDPGGYDFLTEEDNRNASLLRDFSNQSNSDLFKLIVKDSSSINSFNPVSLCSNLSQYNNISNIPMPIASGRPVPVPTYLDFTPMWSNNVQLSKVGISQSLTCVIAIDMSMLSSYTGNSFTLDSGDPNLPNNLTITVNQVD